MGKSYLSELQHCWTSAEGKAESYNETYRNSEKTEYFDNFLFFHPTVGGHFRTRANNTKDDLEEEEEVETKMHEIKRKSVTAGLFNYLILDEINSIFNSVTKTHFHFMVHCLIKGRNSYTTYCYKNKKKPLLPSAILLN